MKTYKFKLNPNLLGYLVNYDNNYIDLTFIVQIDTELKGINETSK